MGASSQWQEATRRRPLERSAAHAQVVAQKEKLRQQQACAALGVRHTSEAGGPPTQGSLTAAQRTLAMQAVKAKGQGQERQWRLARERQQRVRATHYLSLQPFPDACASLLGVLLLQEREVVSHSYAFVRKSGGSGGWAQGRGVGGAKQVWRGTMIAR